MKFSNFYKTLIFLTLLSFLASGCKGPDGKFKLPGGDARKTPADPKLRVQQNLREGKGIRFNDAFRRYKRVWGGYSPSKHLDSKCFIMHLFGE